MKTRTLKFEDLVDREARSLASDIITNQLAKNDLPPPRDTALEFHIDALLSAKPEIRTLAEERVKSKQDAYSTGLRAIGITPNFDIPGEVLDLGDLDLGELL